MELLLEPFGYAFFVRALLAGVIVGALCGALSVFVVLRHMSYIGHGLAHAVLGGVAVAVALGHSLYLGAIGATIVSAVLIDRVARRRGLHADASIGIVTTAVFAVGVLVLSITPVRVNLEAMLFGNILGVTATDLWVAGGVAVLLAATFLMGWKPLVAVTFDREVSRVHGIRTGRVELVFNLLAAAVVVASVRVLGVLLIAAAVVIPGALARLVSRSIGRMLAVAVVAGVASALIGLYVSFHANVASGPAIVLVGAAAFACAYVGTAVATRTHLGRARLAAKQTSP